MFETFLEVNIIEGGIDGFRFPLFTVVDIAGGRIGKASVTDEVTGSKIW